jgi:HAD superfamily hydrolase (TIGR01509 family)
MIKALFPKLLIFDFDGVLVDSELIIHQILIEEIAHYGPRFKLNVFMNRFAGRTTADIVKIIKIENKVQWPDDFLKHLEEQLLIKLPPRLRLTPGTIETLPTLSELQCVASNASEERLHYLLNIVNLSEFFKGNIFSAEMVAHPKPHPDLFLFSAKTMGVSPQDCLVIEDSVTGIKAAKAAGMKALGFTGAHHLGSAYNKRLLEAGAALIFKNMSELPSLLESLRNQEAGIKETL